jgi:ferredoxin
MTFVVTESCIHCKYTDCVDVCPVDCFHEGGNFLVIDPEVCIDCGVCAPECPVEAIVEEGDLSPEQMPLLAINAQFAKIWPVISTTKAPLEDAEQWADRRDKLNLINDIS